jgi:hypothetical protein
MDEPGSVYLSLKLAAKLFGKPLESLAPDELHRVHRVAARQSAIETLILATPEAASVILPENSIDASLTEIRGRYGNDQDYQSDLERIGLNAHSLRQAVARDMVVEAVLERVAAQAAVRGQRDRCRDLLVPAQGSLFRRAETRCAAAHPEGLDRHHQRATGGQPAQGRCMRANVKPASLVQ